MKQRIQFKSGKNKTASSISVNLHLKEINNWYNLCLITIPTLCFMTAHNYIKPTPQTSNVCRSIDIHILDGLRWALLVKQFVKHHCLFGLKIRKAEERFVTYNGEFNIVKFNPI